MPRRVWVGVALVGAVIFALPRPAPARVEAGSGRAAVAPVVYRSLARTGEARVIVALRPAAHGRSLASTQAAVARVQRSVLARAGKSFKLGRRYKAIPALAGRVGRAGLRRLLTSPGVAGIGPDRRVHADDTQSVALVGADKVHNAGYNGSGVTVAVLDTGVDLNNQEVADSVTAQGCFLTGQTGTGACPGGVKTAFGAGTGQDDEGHGTAVTGIITAPTGVAPGASIVDAKVLSHDGSGYTSDILAGLDWISDDHPEVKVVNLSLGSDEVFSGACDNDTGDGQAEASVLGGLRNAGVLTFAAVGNDGTATKIEEPACIASVEAVGAVYDGSFGNVGWSGCTDPVTAADKVACFSDASTMLDLLAPGAIIQAPRLGGGTDEFDGTSAATPHASAVAALLLQARPDLTANQLENVLKVYGVQVHDPRNNMTFPRVDAFNALSNLKDIGTAPGPSLLPDETVTYPEPFGDAPSGRDIGNVTVASQHGVLTFTVTTAASLATGDFVDIRLDTDKNPATGDPAGVDYRIRLDASGGAMLSHWSGGGFSDIRTLPHSFSGSSLTVTVSQSELGIGGPFAFQVAAKGEGDTAPATGMWLFPAFTVTVQFDGSGHGSVAGTVACRASPCTAVVPAGSSLSLTATADAGSVFGGWGGLCSGASGAQCNLPVNADTQVQARFEALRRLTVAVQGLGAGTVTSAPGGINCGTHCDAQFANGTSVTLTAHAERGSQFQGWTGACARAGGSTCTVDVDKAESVSARFADVGRPTARAFAGAARRGTLAQLRFRLVDNSGRARASVTVTRGGSRLASLQRRAGAANGVTQVRWRVPTSLTAGVARFCVRPADASGNVGRSSCAALRIGR